MKFLIHVLNVLSAFVPDFFLLSLIAAEMFGLYSIAKACGLIPRIDVKLAAEAALALAYFVAIAVDMVNELPRPAPSRPGMRTRQTVETPCELLMTKQPGNLTEEGVLATRP